MSVIVKGMDMPDCQECNFRAEFCDLVVGCPRKSVERLIKEIKNIDLDKTTNDFYGMQKKVMKLSKNIVR